jgi:hypothetical protein
MATFGQGINPQLGAIDYSPILRGSLAGAQMAAQGSQMIGQGLANLGQEVGKGVAAYYKKQEIKKLEDDGVAFIQNLGTTNPYILQAVGIKDPNDTKAIKAGMKAVGGVENFFKMANVAKGEMDKTQAADILMRYGASGGESSYMGADGQTLGSPEANMMAQNQYMAQTTERLKQDELKSQVALNRANAKKAAATEAQPTTAMQNASAVVAAEIAAGLYPAGSQEATERYASVLSTGGREVGESYSAGPIMADSISGANPIPTVRANRGKHKGQIGTVDAKGVFTPTDLSKFSPVSPGDVNAFLDAPSFQKLSDKLIAQENSIKQLKRYTEGVGTLSTGLDKAATAVSALIKTSITKQPLTEDEKTLGLSVARQQGLLGAFKGVILGGGVLTEQDAMRILERFGGDIKSISTNREIVKQAINEVLEDKMNEYQQDYNLYQQGVLNRYGKTGYKQRTLVSIEEKPASPLPPIPPGSSFDYTPDGGLTPTP